MIKFTPSQAKSLKNIATKTNKTDAIAMASQIVGEIGVKVISTIYDVKNEKQRQNIVAYLDKLDTEQISELADNLNNITDSNARLQELTSFLNKSVSDKLNADISGKIYKENLGGAMSDRKKIYIAVGVTLAIFLTIIVVKKITK
jgi:hypothetical protein